MKLTEMGKKDVLSAELTVNSMEPVLLLSSIRSSFQIKACFFTSNSKLPVTSPTTGALPLYKKDQILFDKFFEKKINSVNVHDGNGNPDIAKNQRFVLELVLHCDNGGAVSSWCRPASN